MLNQDSFRLRVMAVDFGISPCLREMSGAKREQRESIGVEQGLKAGS